MQHHKRQRPKRKPPIFSDASAYIDTLHLYFPEWRSELAALVERHGQHRVKVRRRRLPISENREKLVFSIRVTRLTTKLLRDLAAVQFANGLKRASISRLDLAVDWTAETDDYRYRLSRFLWRHLVLRHRRAGDMQWWRDSGAYAWKTYKKGRRPPAKNLVVYADRPSKLTRRGCVHFELRIIGGQACKRAGLDRVADLLNLNPAAHFARSCRLVTHPQAKGSLTIFHQRYPREVLREIPWSRLHLPTRLACVERTCSGSPPIHNTRLTPMESEQPLCSAAVDSSPYV